MTPYDGEEKYIFISYSHLDKDSVLIILERLYKDGYRLWFDEGVQASEEWDDVVAKHLAGSSFVMAFLSEAYFSSDPCKSELRYANDHGITIIPLYLNDTSKPHYVPEWAELRIGRTKAIFADNAGQVGEKFFSGIYNVPGLQTCIGEQIPAVGDMSGSAREKDHSTPLSKPCDIVLSREMSKAEQANREFLERVTVIRELLPKIDGAEGQRLEELLCSSWSTDKPHLILLADGGMGKTTMLLDLCRESEIPALYIPVERLDALNISIREYCTRVLFDGDEHSLQTISSIKKSTPILILLIDGLNEVEGRTERRFINEIKALNLLPGIQLVITSRSDFTPRYSMPNYRIGKLKPLDDDIIESLFPEEEWNNIKDTITIHRLLGNPMMVTMYKEICPIMNDYKSEECLDWIIPIKNATDLIHDYYVAQIAVMLHRTGMDGQKAQIAYQSIFSILPAIAYSFESEHSLNKGNNDFRVMLSNILRDHIPDEKALLPLQERFRDFDIPELKIGPVIDFYIKETRLLYKDDAVTAFPHQIYRDYLSAVWIVHQTDFEQYWNSRGLPFPIMEHVRNLSGKYWDGLARQIHEAGKNNEIVFHLVGNLLDCFKYTDTSGCPDYSYLDLRNLQIPDVPRTPEEKISLCGAKIDNVSIGKPSARIQQYTNLCFSDNNEFLAATANKNVIIFSLQEESDPYIYRVGEGINRLAFSGQYLFAVKNSCNTSVHVFRRDANWIYIGEIRDPRDYRYSLFNNKFHSLILKDDTLFFYYSNKEVRYSLLNCEKTYNRKDRHPLQNHVEGIDMSYLKDRAQQRNDPDAGIICWTENNGLKATASIDGGLVVSTGVEIQQILARGITLLKDAAISGDGKSAVTLSYEKADGNRKVQLWDLNKRIRTGEIQCPGIIDSIHISEEGSVILGETRERTWVYNSKDNRVEWYDEHFVSNQQGRISTYETKVLRKNKKNDLFLYDLRTGEITTTDNPCGNAKLACFMADGSIAAVGKKGLKVKFKSIRTGQYLEVNSQNAPVIGISSLKNEPFIVVATQDGVISVYHAGEGVRKQMFNKRKIIGNSIMAVSPKNTVIACSDRKKGFQTLNYYTKVVGGKKMGWWYPNQYSDDPRINGDVLDLAFNVENQELVVILSNGQIVFCHEKYCRFHSATDIITNFNIDAYDYRGCICDQNIKEQIRQNGGLI